MSTHVHGDLLNVALEGAGVHFAIEGLAIVTQLAVGVLSGIVAGGAGSYHNYEKVSLGVKGTMKTL